MADEFTDAFPRSVRSQFSWLAELGFSEIIAHCEPMWCEAAFVGASAFLRVSADRRDDWFTCHLGPLRNMSIPPLQISLPKSPEGVTELGIIPMLRGKEIEPRQGFGSYRSDDLPTLDAAVAEASAAVREQFTPVLLGEFEDFRQAARVLIARRDAGVPRPGL